MEGLRALGKPADFAKYYHENDADEQLIMDVVASLYERNHLHDIVLETAKNIFIPLNFGRGLRTLDDIKLVLRSGADKGCLNIAAVKNQSVIEQAAKKFGASTKVNGELRLKHNGARTGIND